MKPVLHYQTPTKIYVSFNITNTLTKASWIFKGMSKQNSSSFWSYNKTNKFYSQLLYHMFPMAFILHKPNSSFEQNTTSQRLVTEGRFLIICQFLATASSEVWTRSWILPENKRHIANGFYSTDPARMLRNPDQLHRQFLEADLWSDSYSTQVW